MFGEDEIDKLQGGQTLGSLRSRALLAVLADDEAARVGVTATRTEIGDVARFFRQQFDLHQRCDMESFFGFSGLDLADFSAAMRTFRHVVNVQNHHREAIDALSPRYRGLLRLSDWGRQS